MNETATDWASTSALTIKLGDQIRHGGFWRTVTAVQVTPGVDITVWIGEHRPLTFQAGVEVMARTVEMQRQRREDAKDSVDKLLDKVQVKASGWLSKLAGKLGRQ